MRNNEKQRKSLYAVGGHHYFCCIGIVAAITVPMLSNGASDKKWNTAKQKAQATIGEAFRLMTVNGEITTKNSDGTKRTTEYIVTKVLPNILHIHFIIIIIIPLILFISAVYEQMR